MDTRSQSVTHSLVGSREVYLCDSLFDEVAVTRLADALKTLRYRRVERSRPGTDVSGGSAEIPDLVVKAEPMFEQMKSFAEDAFAVRLSPHRLYVNATVYGDMYYPHRDFAENEAHITLLYYANPIWSADWGGETILYSDDGDAQMAVTPRPGRVLAFRGAILHRGGVPTRICFEERLTVAYKFRVPESAAMPGKAAAEGAPGRSLAEAVAAVSAAVAANDYPLAARLGEESLASGQAHPAFFDALAQQAAREGRDEAALELYERARALSPRDVHPINAMGLCLVRLSRFQEAIYAFEQTIRIAPAHAPSHHLLGLALERMDRWDLAERAHDKAVRLDPRYAEAIARIAAIAARKGDGKSARSHADRALKLDPANATALAVLAALQTRDEKLAP